MLAGCVQGICCGGSLCQVRLRGGPPRRPPQVRLAWPTPHTPFQGECVGGWGGGCRLPCMCPILTYVCSCMHAYTACVMRVSKVPLGALPSACMHASAATLPAFGALSAARAVTGAIVCALSILCLAWRAARMLSAAARRDEGRPPTPTPSPPQFRNATRPSRSCASPHLAMSLGTATRASDTDNLPLCVRPPRPPPPPLPLCSLSLTPSVPRFVRAGDAFEAGAIITVASAPATVTVNATVSPGPVEQPPRCARHARCVLRLATASSARLCHGHDPPSRC